MRVRVNGWVRVWLVCVLCLGVYAAYLIRASYPTAYQYRQDATAAKALTPTDTALARSADALADAQISNMSAARREWWLEWAVVTALPALLLALVIGLIAWVRRGFRPQITVEIIDP